MNWNFRTKYLTALAGALLWLGNSGSHAHAQVITAGELFVDLSAANYDPTSGTWANLGSLGNFTGVSAPDLFTSPQGVQAVAFDGVSYFDGPIAPGGLTGLDATRTIEVWALNPSIASEETLVSWGRRGGGPGTNMAFNYGNHQLYGAVGHWDFPDKGWNNDDATAGAPEAFKWHHLVYTFDGTTTKVYSDGEFVGQEVVGAGVINTHSTDLGGNPLPIRIATQTNDNGTIEGGLRGTLAIGAVRIHDGVLSDVEVLTNYLVESENYPQPAPPPAPTPANLAGGPIHRYSFSEGDSGGADVNGRTIIDSIGGAHGTVLGAGAVATANAVKLPGGASATAAYVDLPNELISPHEQVTLEGWFTLDGSQSWARVFDFGASELVAGNLDGGEVTGPGGGGRGTDYLILSAQIGTDTANQRIELVNEDPTGGTGGNATVDSANAVPVGEQYHFAVTFGPETDFFGNETTAIKFYRNGELKASRSTTAQLSQIDDVNNWLGRSNWAADANTQGTYDEFRIYDRALSADELLGNYQAGADRLTPEPTAGLIMLMGAVGGLLMRRRIVL